MDGEGISATTPVELWYRDSGNTSWLLLGTVTASGQELVWTDTSTRPNSKYIELAVQLYTNNKLLTPVVEAIRIKYHANIQDRYSWAFPILVSDNQEMIDGEIRPQTDLDDRDFISTLERKVPPIVLVDIDGASYRVKAQQASTTVQKYEWYDDSAHYDSTHYLSVVEV